jgi:hypothetical protein
MAAREANDNVADAQSRYPDRIRWFTSLPWGSRSAPWKNSNAAAPKGSA